MPLLRRRDNVPARPGTVDTRPERQRAFEALCERDQRRGTRRDGYLLLARRFRLTPRSRVKGIAGY